jgi:hypothetical protein
VVQTLEVFSSPRELHHFHAAPAWQLLFNVQKLKKIFMLNNSFGTGAGRSQSRITLQLLQNLCDFWQIKRHGSAISGEQEQP